MKEKVILLTGASSGIGFSAAQLLARAGHKVYGAARRLSEMEPLRADGVVPLYLDVTDEASCRAAVEQVLAAEGRIDVLVNNAGFGYFGALETVPLEDARRQMEVNVFGLARLTQLVLPGMRGRRSGRVVNVASIAGKIILYFGGWYHVSKFAVEAYSDALRMEMKPFGVDVSIIEPGGIRTPWGGIAADHLADSTRGTAYEKDGAAEADFLRKAYGMKVLTGPQVVARAILRAATARRPRVRYRVGLGSSSLIWLHHLLPARWWDSAGRIASKIKL